MKLFKRTLALGIALLFVLGALAGCKKDQGEDATASQVTTAAGEQTDIYGQVIPSTEIPDELDYGGKAVTVIMREHQSRRGDWFSLEGETDELQKQIVVRNQKVEADLGVKFDYITTADENDLSTKVMNAFRAGGDGIDIISQHQYQATMPALMNCFANLNSTNPQTGARYFTYLNFDKPWWNKNFNNAAMSQGKIFIAAGDMNLSLYKTAFTMYFNETQLEARNIVTDDELYQLVIDGKWTFEKLKEYTKNAYKETGEVEGVDPTDFYGFESNRNSHMYDGWVAAFNLKITEEDAGGMHSLVTGTNRQKLIDAGDALAQYFDTADVNKNSNGGNFEQNRALFGLYCLNESVRFYQTMTDKFGVVPMPKYDEKQAEYAGGVQDSFDCVSVMWANPANFEMISAVLESLNKESYSTVRPYFIENIIKTRSMENPNAAACVDIILKGTAFDFADVYAQKCGTDKGSIRNVLWRNSLRNGDAISTTIGTYESEWNSKLAQMDQWLQEAN